MRANPTVLSDNSHPSRGRYRGGGGSPSVTQAPLLLLLLDVQLKYDLKLTYSSLNLELTVRKWCVARFFGALECAIYHREYTQDRIGNCSSSDLITRNHPRLAGNY